MTRRQQSRAARFGDVPRFLYESAVGDYLQQSVAREQGLWSHQSLALEKLGAGRHVVISTGTASGKSLVFRANAFHRILRDRDCRVVVFYPLKALAADQMRGWVEMAKGLGLAASVVGRIDGSVRDFKLRDGILEESRVVLMTPDVFQAWLMSRLAIPVVKSFLRQLAVVIMDEAHTLEGVFGSNFAYLLRRVLAARQLILKDAGVKAPLQFVAATATIANPREQLQELTGFDFDLVDDRDDGSPQCERICAHVAAPPGEEMVIARQLQGELVRNSQSGGFITFIDSRKGVEALARSSQAELRELFGDEGVMPYRAGYDAKDREAIERRLQAGRLRGVVSTSALELGIDLPHLVAGINVGVPATRKAYRQRLGRVGRASQGAFLVVAPPPAFTGFGTSFREYHDLSVEESYLYLDNRFMQFAHARCLVDELEALGAGGSLPSHGSWPEGFEQVFGAAKPGGNRPPEFDAIAQLGGDSPQRSYPLRNVGELSFKIARGENVEAFGEANESQALRECYPGAIYLHMAKPWEVVSWHISAFAPYIKVKLAPAGRQTRPRIKTWINAGIAPVDLMEGHLLMGMNGFLAECQMQITEKVEGYTEVNTGEYRGYQELRQRNPNMRPRMRNFRTSGVIVCVDEDWFKVGANKQWFADRLNAVFAREYSVLPQDIGSAATNISVRGIEGGGLRGDCIVVFDQTYGSLRLTERLFLNFAHLLERLAVAAACDRDEGDDQPELLIERLKDAYGRFEQRHLGSDALPPEPPSGYLQVFIPGSRVCYREKGKMASEVEVIQPTMMDGKLMYQVKCTPSHPGASPARRWVGAEYVEPSAESGEWDYGWWNAKTETYEGPPEPPDVPSAQPPGP